MKEEQRLKMALISGAAHALSFKKENPEKTDEEAIKHVTEKAEKILEKIDDEI